MRAAVGSACAEVFGAGAFATGTPVVLAKCGNERRMIGVGLPEPGFWPGSGGSSQRAKCVEGLGTTSLCSGFFGGIEKRGASGDVGLRIEPGLLGTTGAFITVPPGGLICRASFAAIVRG